MEMLPVIPGVTTDEAVRLAFSADASGRRMMPEGVARPTSIAEVVEVLRESNASRTAITIAGAQTSYLGGSITDRGIVLSLRAMDRILDIDTERCVARVQPGMLLGEIKRSVAQHGFLFAADPTSEDECTIGGAIACNASGARSLKYGPIRQHITSVTVCLATGQVVTFKRPAVDKNTAGLFPSQDPVDWFVGSEGILGVILEAELRLLPLPEEVVGIGIPFQGAREALRFVVAARESSNVTPRCLEFLDEAAFEMARLSVGQSQWANGAGAFVYVEEELVAGQSNSLDQWYGLAEASGAMTADIQVFQTDKELRDARLMRHAVPSTLNERAGPFTRDGGRKVSTDWAVPYQKLAQALETAHAIADRLGIDRSVTFGHAGNGHPHQNFIARNAEEVVEIEAVVEETLLG